MKSAELRGRVVALDFWATWRNSCLAEPALRETGVKKQKKPLALASERRPT